MPKAQETILEIDVKALQHNYKYLSSKLHKNTKFLAVVKAFAYGNDADKIAKYLQNLDIDYFAVAYANEGVALRKAGITKPILVLHTLAVNFDVIVEQRLEPNLYNAKILNEFMGFASENNLDNYPIHIKFNTGLNRLGFWENDVDDIVSKLKRTSAIKVKSLFSHLAASEDINERGFTLGQIERFKVIAQNFAKAIGYQPMLHMCNTSGILNYPEAHFDMVRSGIGLYGFGNSETESKQLKPIASLKTVISQIHNIEKNESVGYNRAYISEGFEKTATLPLGHADGISRIYGKNKGFVTIKGKKAPIIGNVCMDMIMVNITGIHCKEGDEVIVFDGEHTSAETLAEAAGTISYELITSISQRVKRVFV
ncbi:hypothetical protein MHTCC0001_13250 [Flavobacteriaceae bacterium MHTCC 0001]